MNSLKELVDTEYSTDVLVVGSGGAGLRAAIGSAENRAKTTIVSKGAVRRSGVTMLAGCDFWLDGIGACELGFEGDRTLSLIHI